MLCLQFLEDGATEKEEAPIDDTMEDADDLVCTCTFTFLHLYLQRENKNGVIAYSQNYQHEAKSTNRVLVNCFLQNKFVPKCG